MHGPINKRWNDSFSDFSAIKHLNFNPSNTFVGWGYWNSNFTLPLKVEPTTSISKICPFTYHILMYCNWSHTLLDFGESWIVERMKNKDETNQNSPQHPCVLYFFQPQTSDPTAFACAFAQPLTFVTSLKWKHFIYTIYQSIKPFFGIPNNKSKVWTMSWQCNW